MADTEFFRGFPESAMRISGPKPEQSDLWFKIRAAFVPYFKHKSPVVVVLHGAAGRGKSALAAYFALQFVQLRHGSSSRISCAELGLYLRGIPSERPEGKRLFDYVELADPAEFGFLVIDDLGKEAPSPDGRDLVRLVLHQRCEHPCITVFTSNLTEPDLLKHLGGVQEWSRMAGATWIDFSGLPDYRKPARSQP